MDLGKLEMIERRARTRFEIDQNIIVFDLRTIKPLGRLININVGGMLLLSEQPIPLEEHYRVSFSLPRIISGRTTVRCHLESLWSDNATVPDHYWTGFQIIDLQSKDAESIELLIQHCGRAIGQGQKTSTGL